jgi:hypothetical protein
MDATEVIRDHINGTLDGVAANHLLTHVPIDELCAALAMFLRSDDQAAIRDACLIIRDGALMASNPEQGWFRAALREYGVVKQLEENLFTDNHFTRGVTVYTLGKIGSTESISALRLAFTTYRDTDPLLVPELIFEMSWLGVDKWELIDRAGESPVYATRWSTVDAIKQHESGRVGKAKQVERLTRLIQDENHLVSDEARYAYAELGGTPTPKLPRPAGTIRQGESALHLPSLLFWDCAIRFSNYLSQSEWHTYTVRELEDFIAKLPASSLDIP